MNEKKKSDLYFLNISLIRVPILGMQFSYRSPLESGKILKVSSG